MKVTVVCAATVVMVAMLSTVVVARALPELDPLPRVEGMESGIRDPEHPHYHFSEKEPLEKDRDDSHLAGLTEEQHNQYLEETRKHLCNTLNSHKYYLQARKDTNLEVHVIQRAQSVQDALPDADPPTCSEAKRIVQTIRDAEPLDREIADMYNGTGVAKPHGMTLKEIHTKFNGLRHEIMRLQLPGRKHVLEVLEDIVKRMQRLLNAARIVHATYYHVINFSTRNENCLQPYFMYRQNLGYFGDPALPDWDLALRAVRKVERICEVAVHGDGSGDFGEL